MYVGLTDGNVNNPRDNRMGYTIGIEYGGCLTCADDTAIILDDLYQLQVAINMCRSLEGKNILTILFPRQKS